MSMRRGASVCQLLARSVVPRGARTVRGESMDSFLPCCMGFRAALRSGEVSDRRRGRREEGTAAYGIDSGVDLEGEVAIGPGTGDRLPENVQHGSGSWCRLQRRPEI